MLNTVIVRAAISYPFYQQFLFGSSLLCGVLEETREVVKIQIRVHHILLFHYLTYRESQLACGLIGARLNKPLHELIDGVIDIFRGNAELPAGFFNFRDPV